MENSETPHPDRPNNYEGISAAGRQYMAGLPLPGTAADRVFITCDAEPAPPVDYEADEIPVEGVMTVGELIAQRDPEVLPARLQLWDRVEKTDDGYAVGGQGFVEAARLSPFADHPEPDEWRNDRVASAEALNARITAGQPAVASLITGYEVHFVGAKSAQEGFSYRLDDTEHYGPTFKVGIGDEITIPLANSWGYTWDYNPEGERVPVAVPHLEVHSGDEAKQFLADRYAQSAEHIEIYRRSFSPEDPDSDMGALLDRHAHIVAEVTAAARNIDAQLPLEANKEGVQYVLGRLMSRLVNAPPHEYDPQLAVKTHNAILDLGKA